MGIATKLRIPSSWLFKKWQGFNGSKELVPVASAETQSVGWVNKGESCAQNRIPIAICLQSPDRLVSIVIISRWYGENGPTSSNQTKAPNGSST